jgi:hypothetical protein
MDGTQKIQAGLVRAGKIVTVTAEDHSFRLQVAGETARVVPRTTTSEIHRYKANATDKRSLAGTSREALIDPVPARQARYLCFLDPTSALLRWRA